MDRQQLLLAALAGAGENATFTPTQVQTLFLLVDLEAAPAIGGPYFDVRPYDSEPFDPAVHDALSVLEAQRLVKASATARDMEYSLTPHGYRAGTRLLGTLPTNARRNLEKAGPLVLGS
jgi:hypothetical protein